VKWDDLALVGRVARPHGIRGQVVIDVETDFPRRRFQPGAELFVTRRGGIEALTVNTVRFQLERPVLGFAGIDTMDAAKELAGLELRVRVETLEPLPSGSYYRHDLVGCAVVTSGGATIGVVREVEGARDGSRLVVDTSAGEILVPLAAEICTGIDVAAKRVVIDPPEGLLELNDRRG
jgi:16S rRNA processing protein RimM